MKKIFASVGHKLLCLVMAWGIFACSGDQTKVADNSFSVPVEYYKLNNGFKVVFSQDKTAPIIPSEFTTISGLESSQKTEQALPPVRAHDVSRFRKPG